LRIARDPQINSRILIGYEMKNAELSSLMINLVSPKKLLFFTAIISLQSLCGLEMNDNGAHVLPALEKALMKVVVERPALWKDQMVCLLQDGADINLTCCGTHILNRCIGDYEMVKFLIEKGASPRIENTLAYSPLHSLLAYHVASRSKAKIENDCCIAKLLLNAGADLNAQTHNGKTPLMFLFYNLKPRKISACKAFLDIFLAHNKKLISGPGKLLLKNGVSESRRASKKTVFYFILLERGLRTNFYRMLKGNDSLDLSLRNHLGISLLDKAYEAQESLKTPYAVDRFNEIIELLENQMPRSKRKAGLL
jgi:hypothetical protein